MAQQKAKQKPLLRKPESQKETHSEDVFEIAKAYPKLSHLEMETEIPRLVTERIIGALAKDEKDVILRGTKAYAASLKDRNFAMAPEKFFELFEYRAHAARSLITWETPSQKQARLEAEALKLIAAEAAGSCQ